MVNLLVILHLTKSHKILTASDYYYYYYYYYYHYYYYYYYYYYYLYCNVKEKFVLRSVKTNLEMNGHDGKTIKLEMKKQCSFL